MPRYEYTCPDCKKVIELTRSVEKRDDKVLCGECGTECERLPSRTLPPLFSGGGWAKDGYS